MLIIKFNTLVERSLMKKILAFGLCFLLLGCATPDDTYRSILNSPHTAIAKDPVSQAFGMTYKQKNVEYAVYSALATCDSYGTGCILEQINGTRITRPEAQKWRDDYNRNKKYLTMKVGPRGSLVIATDTGQRDKEVKKTVAKKQKKLKKTEIKKTETPKKKEEKEISKEEDNKTGSEEDTLEAVLKDVYGDRKLDNIEGLWGYRRDDEKEGRIYLIFKSDDYLYEEQVIYHPIREFEGQISTKIVKKIDNNLYETKATWLNVDKVDVRNGTIKIIDKFKLKFETSRHCYSSEKECLKAGVVYKKKIWPSKTYADDIGLTNEQSDVLKGLLD